MNKKDIEKIANMLTDDPDVFSETKQGPSNPPDDLEVEDEFKVHDGHEESKEPKEPGKQGRKSSLQDGPDGAKQSKGSPYLKEEELAPNKRSKKCTKCKSALSKERQKDSWLCKKCQNKLHGSSPFLKEEWDGEEVIIFE